MNVSPVTLERCSVACRWAPRVLGAAMLAAAYITSRGIDPDGLLPASSTFRMLVVVAGAVLALWLVRTGSEVYLEVGAADEGVVFRAHGRERVLGYTDIAAIRYDGAMAGGKRWIPAVVVVDRKGLSWRIPAMMDRCRELLDTILERSGDSGARAWAEERKVHARIGRSRSVIFAAYVISVAAVSFSILFTVG